MKLPRRTPARPDLLLGAVGLGWGGAPGPVGWVGVLPGPGGSPLLRCALSNGPVGSQQAAHHRGIRLKPGSWQRLGNSH